MDSTITTQEIATAIAAVVAEEVASAPVEVAAPEVAPVVVAPVKQSRKGGKSQAPASGKGGKSQDKVVAPAKVAANGKPTSKKDAPAAPVKPLAALSDKVAPKVIANKVAGSLEKQGEAHYVKVGDKTYRIAAQPAPIVGFNPKTASPRQKRVQTQASWPLGQWQRYCIGKHEAKERRNAK